MAETRRTLQRVGAALRSPYAPLVAFLVLGLVGVLGFYQLAQQEQADAEVRADIVETQRRINAEQRQRTVAVCDALDESKNDLRRALETLITISASGQETDPEREARIDLFRREAIEPLETPPPKCDEIRAPLPTDLPPIQGGRG